MMAKWSASVPNMRSSLGTASRFADPTIVAFNRSASESRELAMADEARSRLGRGLATLIGDVGGEAAGYAIGRARSATCRSNSSSANPRNPRRTFSDAELDELAASIREHGIIQPIVVRAVQGAPDRYEIIAGERRWRAAQSAGLHDVPIVPVDVSDGDALELAIIENVQRADLNAIEEAEGYQALADEFKRSQDDIAKIVGKSRSHVANTMRLIEAAGRRCRTSSRRAILGRTCARADRRARSAALRASASSSEGLNCAPGRSAGA